jgi:4-hydroxy-2-oxoheptanedioate aldolase
MNNRRQSIRAFRERLVGDRLLTGLACAIPHPAVVEIACSTGHDFVILDTEHTSLEPTTQEQLLRAAEVHGLVSLVKIAAIEETSVRVALDAGACGVIAPHVKSAADVRRLVDFCCFPPRGSRGLCSLARANGFASGDVRDLVQLTNEEIILVPIIEDAEAVENIADIVDADPRIDIYEIGPVDLALSMGLDLDRSITNPSEELRRAIDHVVETLRSRKKKLLFPTRFPNTPFGADKQLEALRAVGADLVYGMDAHVINHGSRQLAALK